MLGLHECHAGVDSVASDRRQHVATRRRTLEPGGHRMSRIDGLNRRAFLRNAGLTALVGAVGSSSSLVPEAAAASLEQAPNGKFDFDTIYNRFGTDSTKFDQQIRTFGPNSVE